MLMPPQDAPESVRDRVAAHVVSSVLTFSVDDRVGGAVARKSAAVLDPIFVLDAQGGLAGVCPLRAALSADAEATFGALMEPVKARVSPRDDQAHAALLAVEHRLSAVPVVEEDGRFAGAVPTAALLEILYREHTEDLHRLAGISREVGRAQSAIEAPPLRRARDRLPWLLVGLAGSGLATVAMATFERRISERVAIAFFVPAIVYLADAMGTQTEAIAVRGLSLSRASIWRLLRGEITTGLIIGAVLAALALGLVSLAFHDLRLAWTVALSILSAGGVAAGLGLALPFALSRAGVDPAFGSGPLATIIQDVLSIFIYFGMVSLLL